MAASNRVSGKALGNVRAAARRLLKMVVSLAATVAAISVLIGLLLDADPLRSIAIGFYLAGSFMIAVGFLLGNRGPARMRGDASALPFAPRRLRWATREEHEEAINSSAVFVVLGFVLIILGVLADTRHQLF
jgi:uncharacterized membrane protein HdeD (DUF308 family)